MASFYVVEGDKRVKIPYSRVFKITVIRTIQVQTTLPKRPAQKVWMQYAGVKNSSGSWKLYFAEDPATMSGAAVSHTVLLPDANPIETA